MSYIAVRQALLAKPKTMRWWIFSAGICITGLVAVLAVAQPSFFRFLDAKTYDSLLRTTTQTTAPTPTTPVIIDIDEQSLARFGQWPWPRYRIAQLLENTHRLGATSIALDMVFPEPDRTSLTVVQKDFQQQFGHTLSLAAIPAKFLDNDLFLAATLTRGPFILSYAFLFSAQATTHKHCPIRPIPTIVSQTTTAADPLSQLFSATGVTCSLDRLSRAAPASGFFNVIPDEDGVLRRAPLLIKRDGKIYPSLALAAIMQAHNIREAVLLADETGLVGIRLDGRVIPVDSRANLLLRFQGPQQHFTRIPAADILLDKVPRQMLQGKIAFIGTSAVGLEEHRTTPLASAMPGVEIHATVADNIAHGNFSSHPDWAPGMELLLVAICGIASAALLGWTGSMLSFTVITISGIILWLSSGWLLQTQGTFFSPLFPLLTLGGNFTALTFLKYLREERTVKSRDRELVAMQNFTIQCLAALTETRDSETGRHIERCQHYVKLLADHLAGNPDYAQVLNEESIDLLYRSASLHDIGKVGVPDRILMKPSTLTEEEYGEMKKHTIYGREAIQRAEKIYGQKVNDSFLQFGKVVAYSHHEKWDGSGYPEGLAGENIPLFGRIMALADVYDALICKRRYKPSFSHEEAMAIILHNRGSHFDPMVVDAFLAVQEEFHKVAQQLPDE
jgi:adenylate cyclase